MCFFKKTNKKIQSLDDKIGKLSEKIESLSVLITGSEYEKLKKDSEKLQKTEEMLELIKFKIEKIRKISDEEGKNYLRIKYSIPDIVVEFDENNVPIKNETFYAINYLEMISLEDITKLNNEFYSISRDDRK